jgi:hypothetical protein
VKSPGDEIIAELFVESELALLQPLKKSFGFPFAENSGPDFVVCRARMDVADFVIGNECSFPFFVISFGSVISSSCIHEV